MAQNENFKIFTKKDAEQAAQDMQLRNDAGRTERALGIKTILENVNKFTPESGAFNELGVLLQMPEEQFAILAPIFIDSIEKSFNNTEDRLLLAQAVNAAGLRLEDIQLKFRELYNKIDENFKFSLSFQKREFLKKILSINYNAIAETECVTKRIVQVPIELTSENAQIPKYANLGDGAVDLYSPADYTINPGETIIIPCDIKVALPYGYAFLIHPRSGTSAKTKLRVANSVGLVDSQYKGVIGVIIENIEPPIKDITYEFDENGKPVLTSVLHGQSYTISKGERFAQMRLVEVPTASFYKVDTVDGIGDDRGGGFGSSGDK